MNHSVIRSHNISPHSANPHNVAFSVFIFPCSSNDRKSWVKHFSNKLISEIATRWKYFGGSRNRNDEHPKSFAVVKQKYPEIQSEELWEQYDVIAG
jgi:hypothetical protein